MITTARPLISVVVPSLNSSEFLPNALRSALGQGVELEVVIQDGGSTDGTHHMVAALQEPRIRFFSGQDSGQADAINRAVAHARGDWMVWLNADDVLVDGALQSVTTALDDCVDFVYGDALLLVREEKRSATVPRTTFRLPRILSATWVCDLLRQRRDSATVVPGLGWAG